MKFSFVLDNTFSAVHSYTDIYCALQTCGETGKKAKQLYKTLFNSLRIFFVLFSSGVEHHIRQLADVCLPHLVLHAVDGEGPEALRHAVFSLHGGLWQPADSSAVHWEF